MSDDVCDTVCEHENLIDNVKKNMDSSSCLFELADLFKVLGDFTRIRILNALVHSELCVCDLAAIMEMGSSAISHQLRVLRAAKIVKFRREGKNVFYSLDDDHVYSLMNEGLEHVKE
ncbi:MAG: transcriptional regulator [Deltaproteobacteria bacterium]|nr:MAG: transcriptional regulator [Deltaproteobacteria bacterium]